MNIIFFNKDRVWLFFQIVVGCVCVTFMFVKISQAQSFEDAFLSAIEQDKRLRSASFHFQASEFGVEEAYAERHPKFDGATSYDIVSDDAHRTRTFELTLSQPLYKFGYYGDLVKASKKNRDFTKNSINVLKQQIFEETAIVYTRILLNESIVKIELEREKDLKNQYEAINNEVIAGVKDEHQLDLVSSYSSQAYVDKLKAENEVLKSRFQFKRVTGLDAKNLDKESLRTYLQDLPDNYKNVIVMAEAFSPQITALKLNYERQNLELAKQKGLDLPSIDMYTRYQYGVSSGSDRNDIFFGLRLSLPIHRGGLRSNRNDRVDAEIEANVQNEIHEVKMMYEEIVNVWLDYKNGLKEIEFYQKATDSSYQQIEKLEQVLSADLQDLSTFLEAKKRYYDVYKQLIYAQHEQIVKGYRLLRSIGLAKLR